MDSFKSDGSRLFAASLNFRSGAKKQQEELEWFRTHDSFTSLANVEMLFRDFSQLKQRDQWAFVLIRINGFIRLNSIFGLELGGKTIQRFCPLLSDFAKRQEGRAYRLSIDHLALLARASDREAFRAGLEETIGEMEAVQVEDQHTVYSYHYAFAYGGYFLTDRPDDFHQIEQLLAFTGLALQQENDGIGSGGSFYDVQTKPKWATNDTPLPDVQAAWRNGEFVPCYQPVYDLKSNRPIGAELLIRWRHPERGLIPPGEFLPLMEAEGLMMDMDLYMLEAACKKIRGWIDAELLTIPLSINICKQNIFRADFLPRLIEIVTSYDIPPVLIELELSEAALLHEKDESFFFLTDQLHRLGFILTMDDFAATETSSVHLLRELPVDTVKINRRFLDKVEESGRDSAFVTGILRMLKEMDVRAIGTGIETKEQAALWMNTGCSMGQGFFFSPPLFNDDFEKLIF